MATGDQLNNPLVEEPCAPEADGGVKRKRRGHKRSAEAIRRRRLYRARLNPTRKNQFNDSKNERHLLYEHMSRNPEMVRNPSVHEFLKKNLPDFSRFDQSRASSDKYGKTISSNDRSSSSKPEPGNAKKVRVAVKRSIAESSDATEPVKNRPKLATPSPPQMTEAESVRGSQNTKCWSEDSHSIGSSRSNLHQNTREINSSREYNWQTKYYVNWDEPTFFNNENSHGVYFQDDTSFAKALNWTNKLYEIFKETPVGILKKTTLIENHIRKTAKEVKMYDAIGSTLTLTQSTQAVIKGYICPQYWKGESCDKTCKKKHKMNCDEFPSVSPDEVFRAISARLMELKRPPLGMVSSLIEWLTEHNESIKVLSLSKILHTKKSSNVCTAICGVFIKHLSTYIDWPPAPVVEYFLKFHYLMMKDHDHLMDGINRLIAYCQVGTYRHEVYRIVRFLLGVKRYTLPFDILDKVLHEVNKNQPSDITMFKDKIKHQLMSFEKCDDPNFRARASRFLRTHFSESSSDPKKVD